MSKKNFLITLSVIVSITTAYFITSSNKVEIVKNNHKNQIITDSKTTEKTNNKAKPDNHTQTIQISDNKNIDSTITNQPNNKVKKNYSKQDNIQNSNTKDLKSNISSNIKIIGNKTVTLPANTENPEGKKITLKKVELSRDFKRKLQNHMHMLKHKKLKLNYQEINKKYGFNKHDARTSNNLIAHDIGMNSVPVFDQDEFGCCTVFAATAALDAKMNAGDYISQQCLLELGNYLENNSKGGSGWNGLKSSFIVYQRIQKHGIIDKYTCPNIYPNRYISMSDFNYESYSNKQWAKEAKYRILKDGNIKQVKKAINNNHRVTVGILLNEDIIYGEEIFNYSTGLWKIPANYNKFYNEMFTKNKIVQHEIIIIGYDDDKQLFKIRNSWGDSYGDNGDFYMDYEYYEYLTELPVEVL